MTTQQLLTCIGLVFDIIGVIVLFIYGLPADISKEGLTAIAIDDEDKNEIAKWKKYNFRSRIALTLIIIGFAFQILAIVWTVIVPVRE